MLRCGVFVKGPLYMLIKALEGDIAELLGIVPCAVFILPADRVLGGKDRRE